MAIGGYKKPRPEFFGALRVVLPYVIFASLWILLSDRALLILAPDVHVYSTLQIYKGLFFVLVSAALLLVLLRTELRLRWQAEHDRTDLLQREQAARAKAETANRAKDELLSLVSHELRTPLTTILTTTELLRRDTTLSPDVREMIEAIQDSVVQESRIVDDLLDGTSLAAGRLSLSIQPLDVRQVIQGVVHELSHQMKEKRLRLATDFKAVSPELTGDPARLAQVFRNLLTNAIKFTAEEGEIVISTFREAGSLHLDIQDTGIGMPKDILDRLFQPFEQGDRSITRQFGGVGLGLYVAKSIVELHGGSLTAQSHGYGKGSIFHVTLPIATPPQTANPATIEPHALFEGLSVLLVEDNIDTLRVLGRILGRLGCTIHAAQSAAQATELASTQKIDVVLSDIGLPDRTGWDLMRELKSVHSLPGIAFSGFDSVEDVEKSRAAGFRSHLVKPVTILDLQSALQSVAVERKLTV